MIWSSHSQYGLYHQSSRFRPQTPQDALIAQCLEEAADEIQTQYWKSLYPEKIKKWGGFETNVQRLPVFVRYFLTVTEKTIQ